MTSTNIRTAGKKKRKQNYTHQHFHPQRKFHQVPAPLAHALKFINKSLSRMRYVLFKLLILCWNLK